MAGPRTSAGLWREEYVEERHAWFFAILELLKSRAKRLDDFVAHGRFFFTSEPVTNWESAKKSDTQRFGEFHRRMLDRGIYLAPSQFEAAFVSAAHTEQDVRKTVEAFQQA